MDFSDIDCTIDRVGSERTVAELAPWLTEERRERIEQVLAGRLDSLHVAVERPEDPYNAAAIVRSAEALGALHVHVVTEHGTALHARRTTQGSFNWVHTYHHPELADLVAPLQRQGVRICGALMSGSYRLEQLPVDAPLCLLFGNEKTGLSPAAVAACDLTFRIPMFGMSESLNLSVSASLALYSSANRRRAFLGREGDLTGERLLRERARYYARCVDERTLLAL
ncbi:MAG: putative tRNA/rRNA methyltransferase [Myxococcaceae bacterium]|nr:putative tRNA/rRNA methyltransferase [Myxococcaceae bacterium]